MISTLGRRRRVNLVLIVCDTLRRDYLGCYGNDWVQTPALDDLAASGVTFEHCYVGSFPTVPQRHDLMCSNHVFHTTGWAPIQSGNTPLQQRLQAEGYVTQFIADHAQLMAPGMNYHMGFDGVEWIRGHIADRWRTEPVDYTVPCDPSKLRQPEHWVEDWPRNYCARETESDWPSPKTFRAAEEWLERNREHEKFYLLIDTFDVHEPWLPPQHYTEMYDPGYEGDEAIYPRYDHAGYLTEAELQHVRGLYAGSITMMDRAIGRFLQKLEDLGLAEQTAVAFTSDHGWYFGEHNYIGKHTVLEPKRGWQFYDEVARVPLIVRAPNLPQGLISHALAQPVDIAPTLMEIAGLEAPADTHGMSVLKALGGGKGPRKVAVTSPKLDAPEDQCLWNAINDGEWTLQHAGGLADPELYHISEDPGQLENVISTHPHEARRLHAAYIAYLEQIGVRDDLIERRRPLDL
jgi:arylsulfatase A-like enzyme